MTFCYFLLYTKTERERTGCAHPLLYDFFITAEALEVLTLNFGPVNKIFLGTFLGPTYIPLYRLRMRKSLILKLCQVLQTNYFAF